MAVPARHTSKSKKNKRRTHYKMTAPTVSFDETTGDFFIFIFLIIINVVPAKMIAFILSVPFKNQ